MLTETCQYTTFKLGERSMLAVAKYLGARQIVRKPFSKVDRLPVVGAALGTESSEPPAFSHTAGVKSHK
jgi:hypothetical protein